MGNTGISVPPAKSANTMPMAALLKKGATYESQTRCKACNKIIAGLVAEREALTDHSLGNKYHREDGKCVAAFGDAIGVPPRTDTREHYAEDIEMLRMRR